MARLGDNLPSVDAPNSKPTAADLGPRRDEIHKARQISNTEREIPGLSARTLNTMIERGIRSYEIRPTTEDFWSLF